LQLIYPVRVLIYRDKKINLHIKAYAELRNMLLINKVDLESEEIQIEGSNRHYYHPLKNTIRIRGFDLKTVLIIFYLCMKADIIYRRIKLFKSVKGMCLL